MTRGRRHPDSGEHGVRRRARSLRIIFIALCKIRGPVAPVVVGESDVNSAWLLGIVFKHKRDNTKDNSTSSWGGRENLVVSE